MQRSGARGRSGGGTWEKEREKKKKANCTKPSSGKAQAQGGREVCLLPHHPLERWLCEAQIGIHPIPRVKELSGRERMAASGYVCVCIYIDIYIYNAILENSLCINIKHWYPNMTPQLTKVLDGSWACVSM